MCKIRCDTRLGGLSRLVLLFALAVVHVALLPVSLTSAGALSRPAPVVHAGHGQGLCTASW